jgi:hypothetical protein
MANQGKNRVEVLADSSRGKQPKISNRVLVALQKVLDPAIDELFGRTLNCNQSLRFFVFSPKRDTSLLNFDDTALCNGRAPGIPACVLQEVLG